MTEQVGTFSKELRKALKKGELDDKSLKLIQEILSEVKAKVGEIVVGQEHVVDALLVALLSNGHVLLEGVPGVAKTLTVRALSKAITAAFKRVQFTPDLMPSDITGVMVYQPNSGEFLFNKGPVFTNILLSDEINRAPPKTQAAMLEAMQERQVSIQKVTHELPSPFFVFATQNPIEQEGTFPLPEAQVDRFMLKVQMGYPTNEEEEEVVNRYDKSFSAYDMLADIDPIINGDDIIALQKLALDKVEISPQLVTYIVKIVGATRTSEEVLLGASPRGSLWLAIGAKSRALMNGRQYVTPADVQANVNHVLGHRVIIKPEYAFDGTSSVQVLERILRHIEVPTVQGV